MLHSLAARTALVLETNNLRGGADADCLPAPTWLAELLAPLGKTRRWPRKAAR